MSKQKVKRNIERTLDEDIARQRRANASHVDELTKGYLRAIVDPGTAKKVGVPTLIGGNPGRTAIITTRAKGVFATGSGQTGFLNIPNPGTQSDAVGSNITFGPFDACAALQHTDVNYTGTVVPASSVVSPAGLVTQNWTTELGNSLSYSKDAALSFRLVAMSVKVFPQSSFAAQNGSITLAEAPSHMDMVSGTGQSVNDIESFENSRTLRGTQTGSQKEKIVLNWHPRVTDGDDDILGDGTIYLSSQNDFAFHTPQPTNSWSSTVTMPINGLLVCVLAASQTAFHYEVNAMWELKGSKVLGKKPRLVNSRGMDHVFNTINRKLQAGYVGTPEGAYESYLHMAASSVRSMAAGGAKRLVTGTVDAGLKALAGFL